MRKTTHLSLLCLQYIVKLFISLLVVNTSIWLASFEMQYLKSQNFERLMRYVSFWELILVEHSLEYMTDNLTLLTCFPIAYIEIML